MNRVFGAAVDAQLQSNELDYATKYYAGAFGLGFEPASRVLNQQAACDGNRVHQRRHS